ncbi:hypothetical protein [Streptomyces sp. CC208A]|nr:hypothetical protein [Streptomyces sp. CC208A]
MTEQPDTYGEIMKDALKARATVGEVCNALCEAWGTYTPSDVF